jgi:drug/metabolite transporter (DMT)-like permease
MATRPAKATGNPDTSRPRRAQAPGKPAPAKAPAKAPAAAAATARATAPAAARTTAPVAAAAPGERPRALRLAAALQALEAAGMCVAAGFAAVSTADGQSYQRASGIALTLIAVGTAVVFALFARGLARARPWTRTPVVMTQLAIGAWGIYLLKDRRPEWGVPMLVVAACCLAALFTPASLRALNRPPTRP